MRFKYPTFEISIIESPDFVVFKPNSIAVVLCNENFEKGKKLLNVDYYYSENIIFTDNGFLDFRLNLCSLLDTLKSFESDIFFQESKAVEYNNFKDKTQISDLRTAKVAVSYNITKLLDIDYYEGDKEIMESLNLNLKN